MKVIFLDIDGVLNDHERDHATGSCWIKPHLVARLNNITASTGAKLVISSAWRYMIHPDAMTLRGFGYMLKTHRVHAEVIGHTVRDEVIATRGGQIKDWLEKHPEVTSYVILDDDVYDMDGLTRIVYSDSRIGLSEFDVDKAIEILNG